MSDIETPWYNCFMEIKILDPVYSLLTDKKYIPMVSKLLSFQAEFWMKMSIKDKNGIPTGRFKRERKTYPKSMVLPSGMFFTGHVPKVVEYLTGKGLAPVVSLQKWPFFARSPQTLIPLRPDQTKLVLNAVDKHRGIIKAPTGFGKSHPKGTELILHSGKLKKVEDIKVGDLLMGPDSMPRIVLNTHKGFGPIYKITPTKGESWECNSPHILSLKRTKYYQKNGAGGKGKMVGGDIKNIPLNEYINKSNNFKHIYKLWRTGVEFKYKKVFDPYLIGLYLADGSKRGSVLCCGTEKLEAINYVRSVWKKYSEKFDRGAWYLSLYNFKDIRINLTDKQNNRKIPNEYLFNSKENRLKLLAGLLDGDGYLVKSTVFEIICKDTPFKDQILYLTHSLGFAAYASICTKKINSTNFTGKYWRICISGDTNIIPTKIMVLAEVKLVCIYTTG